MDQILPHLQFTKEHEWIRIDGESGLVGITDFAQEELGDVTFVELPEIGLVLDRGDVIGVVESVKAASDIFTPLSGEILEINTAVEDRPELVNSDPYGEGWLVRLRIKNPEEVQSLLSSEEYERLIKGES
ncbi:MAG: Glycine cleavage system H protein [Candidatus Moanabacter tarae]|uniref:Glycine cleavage system H protein n=1 Tax=Candidatus Moanibacter tarae TaxID=2200854 RepID=A0A2Z4AI23_9BACT|nr:MAG: Glycine cleavage system H protein [Candidatus Moanabacter tarae]